MCDGVLYLCPICLQQRLVAARLEPAGAPTKAVVDAIVWLLDGVSNMSHWTATGWIPCDPAGATLGDGHTLSTAVGVYIATAGPLLGVAFPSVRAGARSSSHPGLCLDARFARAGDATCRWGMSDGTLARLLHPRDGLCSALIEGSQSRRGGLDAAP